MFKTQNTYYGSILLIAGGTIGAGMLALPVVVGQIGFWLSILTYGFVWLFMLLSGLMLFEALSWSDSKFQDSSLSSHGYFLKRVDDTLGKIGKYTVIFLFMGLFTCLMVAYLDKGGSILWELCRPLFSLVSIDDNVLNKLSVIPNPGSILLAIITFFVLSKKEHVVDSMNRIWMFVLIFCFLMLTTMCLSNTSLENISYCDVKGVPFIVPFLITSFGFHNMLPSIASYNGGFTKGTVKAIIYGSLIPLVVYIIWTFSVLSIIPFEGPHGLKASFAAGKIATEIMHNLTANNIITEWTNISYGRVAGVFAFAAIITSIFGQGMSIKAFAKECIPTVHAENFLLKYLVLCVLLVYIEPNIFMAALEYAGGIFAILLFVLIPGWMLLQGRMKRYLPQYKLPLSSTMIIGLMGIGLCILLLEILKILKIIHM